MSRSTIFPYRNETEVIQINGLTIENRTDRVSLYGSIDFTLDKLGLERARQLLEVMKATVEALEAEELPEIVNINKPETVTNPFE